MDLYLTGRDYYPVFKNLSKRMTLAESIDSQLPEIYRIITPLKDRQVELLKIGRSFVLDRKTAMLL
jgi:alpha-mannosidase